MSFPLPPFSIATISLGDCAHHALDDKLRVVAEAGYREVEVFQADLDAFARSPRFEHIPLASYSRPSCLPEARSDAEYLSRPEAWNATAHLAGEALRYLPRELAAAKEIGALAERLNVRINSLQPLRDFEGWIKREKRDEVMKHGHSRFAVMRELRTDLLLIPSSFHVPGRPEADAEGGVSGDDETVARDLAELADYAAAFSSPMRIAYEALAWGGTAFTWRAACKRVSLANRRNCGLVIDSFNLVGREWADPANASGSGQVDTNRKETWEMAGATVDARLAASLAALKREVPIERIFSFQVADAALVDPAEVTPAEGDPRPSRLLWSRSSRLFPLEKDRRAYLPIADVCQTLLEMGFTGAWSLEVFNKSLASDDPDTVRHHADRGMRGLSRLWDEVRRRAGAGGGEEEEESPSTAPTAFIAFHVDARPFSMDAAESELVPVVAN